jgi:indolepyruvate ferredoxin oxidoreductase
VVSAGAKTLGLMTTGLTGAVVNSHEIVTGDFTRNTEFRIPGEDWHWRCRRGSSEGLSLFDASELSRKLLGDTIFTNQMLLGAAWQRGSSRCRGRRS